MSDRRAPRLVLEIAFLAALAGALSFANLRDVVIAGVMALGWLVVAAFEWGALRSCSHYGSGLPPRWYVPQVSLPAPQPRDLQMRSYPTIDNGIDEPTWIASPAMLAEWPVAEKPRTKEAVGEETQTHDFPELEQALSVAHQVGEAAATARHRLDPLEEPVTKGRRFRRSRPDEAAFTEVPGRPQGSRLLPSRVRGED